MLATTKCSKPLPIEGQLRPYHNGDPPDALLSRSRGQGDSEGHKKEGVWRLI